jgi:hypothetical protein
MLDACVRTTTPAMWFPTASVKFSIAPYFDGTITCTRNLSPFIVVNIVRSLFHLPSLNNST